jgi:aromatic-L-amino-acid decarboxylase
MQCISLNNTFVERIRSSPIFELVTPPSFALSVFRLVPGATGKKEDADNEILNALNRAFYSDLQTCSKIALTHTLISGVFCIRFVVGSIRTEQSDIDDAWRTIRDSGEKTLVVKGYNK